MLKTVLIVPCYNEAARFDPVGFAALAALPDVSLLFLNDGSTDETEAVLRSFCGASKGAASVLSLEHNQGKAEVVRRGLRHALEAGAAVVGYVDADLSTPVEEIARLIDTFEAEGVSVLMGSRIQHLGAIIDRKPLRHYVGRFFATAAAAILRVPVYDTQCGAKILRRSPSLEGALAERFVSRWCFDVELLGRLLIGGQTWPPLPLEEIRELPLRRWRDVPDSKLGIRDSFRVFQELYRVHRDVAARRRRVPIRGVEDHREPRGAGPGLEGGAPPR